VNIDPWILAFSAVTVFVTIWMGFRSAKSSKTASDFFVAGRSVSVGWNASAISGEYLSAASFMGVAGMVMSSGYDALWYPVCYACGYLFLLLFIAGPLRRFGAYTIPDFAEGRFDSPLFRKIAVVFVLFIGFFYTMPQMKGAGTTLAYIFPGLPYWAGVVLVGAVITLNVALGGMKGITLVQAFQYWIKMFAISVPIFVLMAVYGHYGKQLDANGEKAVIQSGVNYIKLHSEPLTNTPSTSLKLEALSILGTNAKRLGITQKTTGAHLQTGSNRLGWTVEWYGEVAQKDAYVAVETNRLMAWIPFPTNSLMGAGFLRETEEALRNQGVVLVSQNEREVRFASTNLLEVRTRQLPAKAPADATWLNPFGPLTTKAAKAAKPKIVPPANLSVVKSYDLFLPGVPGFETRIGGALNGMRTDYATGQLLAYQAVSSYAWCTVRPEVGNLDRKVTVVTTPNLSEILVPIKGATNRLLSEWSAEFSKVLESAGITVIREPGNVFKAFLTKEATVTPIDPKPYSLLYTYSLIIAIVCGTAGLPHILVRFYTNPDGVAAKRTTMWVMILIGVFYVFPPVFGVIGRNLLPELYSGVGAKGTDKIVLELPRIISERYGVLGSILSGITCAGAFAAFMSTFSGLLVSMTGALAHDVYGRMLNPKASAEQRMKMFKWCAVLIGGVAVLLGSFVEPLEINFMVGQAFAIAAASYFPLLFMAVWWRKLTMKGAATGMLTGGLSALVGISLTSFSTLASAPGKTGELFAIFKPLNDFWALHPLLRILCEQPAIWAVPLAIILMVIVSKLTSKDVPEDIRMKMLVLHAPEKLGLKQEYIQEHQHGH
jgi:Na+(H+)/acetate symporter ActP